MPGMPLGDRMKAREASAGNLLPPRMPAVLRVDGRAFHTFTRGFDSPFDGIIEACMDRVATALCEEIGTARLAYGQSDEVSVLLVDYANLGTEQWFGGRRSKMESTAASIATAAFNEALHEAWLSSLNPDRSRFLRSKLFRAHFDARVFPVPTDDAINYFFWRQRDAVRNSVLTAGQASLPRRQMHGMKCDDVKVALAELGRPWEELPVRRQRGFAVARAPSSRTTSAWTIDREPPVFGEDRAYVGRWLDAEIAEGGV